MTQRELIEDIILSANAGRPSDDYLLDYDQIRLWTNLYRAQLIKEFAVKKQILSAAFTQDLGCIDLVCVDKADCCDGFMIDEYWKKLSKPLPTLVNLGGYAPITFVGLVDKITPLSVVDNFYAAYGRYRKYTGRQRRAFIVGGQIYFDLPPGDKLSKVNVRAILFDPRDVNQFRECVCYDEDVDSYPVESYMNAMIKRMILTLELNIQLKTQPMEDRANDSMSTKLSAAK